MGATTSQSPIPRLALAELGLTDRARETFARLLPVEAPQDQG